MEIRKTFGYLSSYSIAPGNDFYDHNPTIYDHLPYVRDSDFCNPQYLHYHEPYLIHCYRYDTEPYTIKFS